MGYDDSFDPKICWDFYSKKVGAEWIDNEAFCIGIYPFMDGHAFGFFELKSKYKNLQQNQWNNIKYPNDNETRIVFATLKPLGTVTTAPKV